MLDGIGAAGCTRLHVGAKRVAWRRQRRCSGASAGAAEVDAHSMVTRSCRLMLSVCPSRDDKLLHLYLPVVAGEQNEMCLLASPRRRRQRGSRDKAGSASSGVKRHWQSIALSQPNCQPGEGVRGRHVCGPRCKACARCGGRQRWRRLGIMRVVGAAKITRPNAPKSHAPNKRPLGRAGAKDLAVSRPKGRLQLFAPCLALQRAHNSSCSGRKLSRSSQRKAHGAKPEPGLWFRRCESSSAR